MSFVGLQIMPDWTLYVPLIGGAVAALIAWVRQARAMPGKHAPALRLLAMVIACLTVLLEAGMLSVMADGQASSVAELSFVASMPARYVLTAANVALLCALIYGWLTVDEDVELANGDPWRIIVACGTSTLLAGAALSTDRLAAALLLFAAALPVGAGVFVLTGNGQVVDAGTGFVGDEERARIGVRERATAGRLAGAFKQLALALLATVLWIAGATILDRYGFSLENTGLLQFGVAMLAVGMVVRAGSMPFAGAWADSLEVTPSAGIVLLGAIAPVALVAGMLMLAPIEGNLARGAAAGWLGAVGALLAGLRAIGTLRKAAGSVAEKIGVVKAMTVAVAVSWGVYGVLSGSQMGVVGGVLVAANIALAVPLLVLGGRWIALIGAASLLGLPPLGGFTGAILIAESAANAGGLWLGLLLLGSALVAAAWMSAMFGGEEAVEAVESARRRIVSNPLVLVAVVLIVAQVALFVLSNSRLEPLVDWAVVPWVTAP